MNVDAHRVVAVLDELKQQLLYLSVCTQSVHEVADMHQVEEEAVDSTTRRLLAELLSLEDLYTRGVEEEIAAVEDDEGDEDEGAGGKDAAASKRTMVVLSRALASPESAAARAGPLADVVQRLRMAVREMVRHLSQNPRISAQLRQFQPVQQRPHAVLNLIRVLSEMTDIVKRKLCQTAEEEVNEIKQLEDVSKREAEASQRFARLSTSLEAAQRARAKSAAQSADALAKLRAELLEAEDSAVLKLQHLRALYESRQEEFTARFEERRQQLATLLSQKAQKFAQLKREQLEAEAGLGKRKKTKLRDAERSLGEYDKTVEELQTQLATDKSDLANTEDELKVVQERYQRMQAEHGRLAEEELLKNARQKDMERVEVGEADNASKLQAFWKAVLIRLEFKRIRQMRKKKGKK